jgi:hypothetical protein
VGVGWKKGVSHAIQQSQLSHSMLLKMLLQIMEFPANYEGQPFQLELQMFPMEIIGQKVTPKKYGP